MDVLEIAPGLWRWTAYHEEWKEDVGCVYVETEDGVVLIDPLVPPEDTAKFWKALDRDVKRAEGPVHVLITVFWHARSASAMRERYDARIWAPAAGKAAIARRTGGVTDTFAPGDPLPGRPRGVPDRASRRGRLLDPGALRARPRRRPARRRQGRRQDVPGVVAAREEVSTRPCRVAPPLARSSRSAASSYRTGDPVLTGGGRALARALEV